MDVRGLIKKKRKGKRVLSIPLHGSELFILKAPHQTAKTENSKKNLLKKGRKWLFRSLS